MSVIEQIKKPIINEMQVFKTKFANSLRTDNPLLSEINEYILEGSGKQLRPILTLLSSKLCGNVTDNSYYGALSLELLHNASLVHDDVIDDTSERRGRGSVQALWTNKVAVLTGDYLLSNALINATHTQSIEILNAISTIGMELADGELLQLINSNKTEVSEENYFQVIRKKTALLFATCTAVGAMASDATPQQVQSLRNFGEYLGICFQIKDDIFDYQSNINIGKPTNNDLRDGKITLPLIYVLKNIGQEQKDEIIQIISKQNFSAENIDKINQITINNGGLDYAESQMNRFKDMAIAELSHFLDSDSKAALTLCAEFACSRKK